MRHAHCIGDGQGVASILEPLDWVRTTGASSNPCLLFPF